MREKIREKLDLSLSPKSLALFRRLIGFLCLYEFLIRIIYFDYYAELSPQFLIQQYLQKTKQDGWSHLLFFVSEEVWYQYLLMGLGAFLSVLLILGKFSKFVPFALAFFWMNFCYRFPFLSHGGDAIVFFSLLLMGFLGFHKHKTNLAFNVLFIFQFTLIMTFAGINKLSGSWLDGTAVELALKYDTFSGVLSLPSAISPLLKWLTLITPYFEIFLPLLFVFKKTRNAGVVLLFAFGVGLLALFNSGTLALCLIAYAVAFRHPKSEKSLSEMPQDKKPRPLLVAIVTVYCGLGLVSSVANLRFFDRGESFWTLPIKELEGKYYFAQNWSFMTKPITDLLKIKMSVVGLPEPTDARIVKSWIYDWSGSPFLDFQMIHRRAIFFKHLFWRPDPILGEIFGEVLCKKENLQHQQIEVQLLLGDAKVIKSFGYLCQ